MKYHLSKELKAGLIVLLIAVAMYWLVYFLKGCDIFSRFTSYRIQYESVEGLNITGPVYIRGFKVGMIKNISYNQQNDHFEVTVQLESRYRIPANSVAQIYSVDLLGTKAIRINMGNSVQTLSHNDLLQSNISADLISYITAELPSIKEHITNLLTGLDSTVENLNEMLGVQNRKNLENALAHLAEALPYFRSLGASLEGELPQIQSILNNLNQFTVSLGASSEDIQTTMSNLVRFTDTLSRINLANIVQDLDLLINQLQNPDNSIGKLLYSDELHQNLSRLLHNLDSLVYNISQNPKRYLKISVF